MSGQEKKTAKTPAHPHAPRGGLAKFTESVKGILKEMMRYTSGKVGLSLLIILVSISIYAALIIPPNYGTQVWNNPKAWEDNPQLVPPEWISLFGYQYAKNLKMTYTAGEGYEITYTKKVVEVQGTRFVIEYTTVVYNVTYKLDADAFPQGLHAKLRGIVLKREETGKEAIYTMPDIKLYITRPDGKVVTLFDKPVESLIPAQNRTFPKSERPIIRDYTDEPLRLLPDTSLIRTELAQYFYEKYGEELARELNANITADNISSAMSNAEMSFLFGEPTVSNGQIVAKPLKGDYIITIKLIYAPAKIQPPSQIEPPTEETKIVVKGTAYGFMGTDTLGRDLAEGLLLGFPVAMAIGVLVAFVVTMIGLVMGVISGYFGGAVDEIIQRTVDVMGNIPLLPILILLANIANAMFTEPPQRLLVIMLALIVFSWGGLTIVVRSMALSIKNEPYIEAAKAVGAGHRRIIFHHILPQIIPYAVANMVFAVPSAILTEAGLAVLGIYHGMPTWGLILSAARESKRLDVWWWILPPGFLIAITSLTFVLIGMSLEKVVEPRLRSR